MSRIVLALRVSALPAVAVPLTALALALVAALPATAQATEPSSSPAPEAELVVTKHQVDIAGQRVDYEATAGWLIVDDAEGKPAARFGFTAYVRQGAGEPAERPLMFAFNGGPGSASIWLHLGVLGPRRVVVPDADFASPSSFQLVDNAYSVLDVADLVMIDPVGTGYSRPVGEAKNEDFWGVDQDIDSVSRFIKAYVTEFGRWMSPKILLGESYGGMRAGGVSWELLSKHNMSLAGVILVSPFMSWDAGSDGIGIDLPHVLYLTTLAATAWYHEALEDRPAELVPFLDEVKAFAYDEYAPALLKGNRLSAEDTSRIAARLARYTGVDAEYWQRADLRVEHNQFLKELLRDRGQTTGRIDSRYVGRAFNGIGERTGYDPMFAAIGPPFTAAFLDYYHRELGFAEPGKELEYKVSGGFWRQWDWGHRSPKADGFKLPHPDTSPDLTYAMGQNPHMRVLVQQGYYDLATPVGATEYAVDHMTLSAAERERIRIDYYEAGHMMYLHPPSLEKYRDDTVRFIRECVDGGS